MIAVALTGDLAACHALRRAVFIEEQGVAEDLEIDGRDGEALHLLATWDGAPVGTARMLPKGPVAKIGRVCVLPAWRGRGVGAAMMREAVAVLRARGFGQAVLGSQVHAIPFYEALGFAAEGAVYDDAGIPHRDMALRL